MIKENQLLGTAYDADSEGIEGKYYTYEYDELKNIENIEKFYDIKPDGNWEGKIILNELKEPNQKVINSLMEIRAKEKNLFLIKRLN